MYLFDVQLEVGEVAVHHVIERNAVACVVKPIIRAFTDVNGADEVANMAVVV